jgi:hypothetical protein
MVGSRILDVEADSLDSQLPEEVKDVIRLGQWWRRKNGEYGGMEPVLLEKLQTSNCSTKAWLSWAPMAGRVMDLLRTINANPDHELIVGKKLRPSRGNKSAVGLYAEGYLNVERFGCDAKGVEGVIKPRYPDYERLTAMKHHVERATTVEGARVVGDCVESREWHPPSVVTAGDIAVRAI